MENSKLNQSTSFLDKLAELVETLRGENGCPWDKKQTPRAVIVYLIEEVYELADAIESGNTEEIREELGDVLFHIFFIARMFQEEGQFDLQNVAQTITEKMIRRHPHVFGEQMVQNSEEVILNWHRIKLNEKKTTQTTSLFDSVPVALPALLRAYRISDRAAKTGFDWLDKTTMLRQVEEELDGVKAVVKNGDGDNISQKFGDLLFSVVNAARIAKIHPETALASSINVFEKRFKKLEESILEGNRKFEDLSIDEKKQIWAEIDSADPK